MRVSITAAKWPVVLLAMSLGAGNLHGVFGNMEDEDWWYLDGGASGAVNASWSMGSSLIVGYHTGDCSLIVSGAGTHFGSDGAYLGYDTAATGRVTIGSGCSWGSGDLNVGYSGSGFVTLYGVLNAPGTIFAGHVNHGDVLVSGGEAALYFSYMYVGTGNLDILGGSHAAFGNTLFVGYNTNDVGVVDVAGEGGGLSADTIIVGYYGTGGLTLRDGVGAVSASGLTVANAAGSAGTVTVSGAGTKLDSDIGVGNYGRGILTVEAGAEVGALSYVGYRTGAEGTVELKGAGTKAVLKTLYFGSNGGMGSITLSGGASLASSELQYGDIYMGSSASLLLTGAGTSLFSGRSINVGYGVRTEGLATLAVESGAVLNASSIKVGVQCPGLVEVRGAGSALTYSASASGTNIGDYRAGTLLVEDEGSVTASGVTAIGNQNNNLLSEIAKVEIRGKGSFSGGDTYIGVGDDTGEKGLGIVKVEGVGSEFLNSAGLFVGMQGTGTLNLTGGALATSASGWVGNMSTGTGVVNVFGLSEWDVGGILNVGAAGKGTLNIKNGGLVESTGLVTLGLGKDSMNNKNTAATGTVRVAGAGSLLHAKASLVVGGTANAGMTVADGGLVVVSGNLVTGSKGILSLADGWLAIENAVPLTATELAANLTLQYFDGEQMLPAAAENLEVLYYDGTTRLWQAGDELFDIYGGKADLTGYTVVRAGESDVNFANAGDGWNHSPWYGWFYSQGDFAGWIYHQFHGWQYVYEGSTDASSYVWDDATASWWWTARQCHPFFYRFEGAKWHCYGGGTTPERSFWVYDGAWSQVAEDEM
jgi:T5SS/PEP-CTERM-associated repeat protein